MNYRLLYYNLFIPADPLKSRGRLEDVHLTLCDRQSTILTVCQSRTSNRTAIKTHLHVYRGNVESSVNLYVICIRCYL